MSDRWIVDSESLKYQAKSYGFTLAGIAPAAEADTHALFEAWLAAGYAGDMAYLHEKRELRKHPRSVFAAVKSVLMLGIPYSSTPHLLLQPNEMKVARYAQGPDYHDIIRAKLNELSAWLNTHHIASRGVVDTAPLLERDFARRAGLGWIGKNTMLINPRQGSYFFLAALLIDHAFEPDPPFEANHCGTCTACLDACPTQAFVQPRTLDATKCISYHTIESKADTIPLPTHDWIFGCDICQEVCPWNRFAGEGALPHDETLMVLDRREVLAMTEEQFRERFRNTALWRTKLTGLKRNAKTTPSPAPPSREGR